MEKESEGALFRIGIGIATPTERLHVHAPSGTAEFRLSDAVTGTTSGRGVYFRMSSTQNADIINFENGKSLQLGTSGAARLTIDGNGNIGIGTSSPQSQLAVNGDIFSKKVKVTQTGWPDYVFHSTYNLRPLSELEQYIQQHQHLPEVPSAATIEKDGLDLGDNQAMLLKKIEELTLYIIEQNKKMEELEKDIADLKKQKKD